ncbi:MAG: rRNA maturation RNase YbeY [Acutalibacteraceae bacterium]|nr:rRNA maturation RNase YbeY [Clostridia bacterium]MEE1127520.1 rRNA maturation RNase YbeY [Acutalibacteraceae bacterium]
MAKVKVTIQNRQKAVKVTPEMRKLIRLSCAAVLENQGFSDLAEVVVTFVDDAEIKKLNNEFRSIDKSTDVLSFPLGEDGEYDLNPETGAYSLGDVVISVEHAVAQSEEYGHSFERELAYLTVHSMLHLLGFDHVNGGDEAALMRKTEEEVMTVLGLTR